jgi:hypothetical protein
MDEQKIADMVKKEVSAWFSNPENKKDGYEYEKTFVECWRSVGQKVFQESMGKMPGSKNEKKLKTSLGDVVIANKHKVSQSANNFRITSYLQDQVCFVGQKETFEEGSETIERMMGIDVSNKQIQRVSEHYGQGLEDATKEQIEEAKNTDCIQEPDTAKIVYGMCDGSMVFTKEEKWKEIKLGRVFKAEDNLAITEKRHEIEESQYCAYLGGHEDFLKRFDLLLRALPV